MARCMDDLGSLEFSPAGEEWIEYGPPDDRQRIGFHDYAAIYAVPGLYEYVFYETLGMRSTREVVRMYAEVLEELGLDIAEQRVVDFGAGNGLGGEDLHASGVGELVGVDLEPMARTAAERDRPGVYPDYLVGDLGAWSEDQMDRLRDRIGRPRCWRCRRWVSDTCHARAGARHGPPGSRRDLRVRRRAALLPESTDPEGQATGYPDYLAG